MKISDWTRKMIKNRNDEVAVDQGCYFDVHAALRVRYFFRNFLLHSKGRFSGQEFDLLDWQWKRWIAPLFGWKKANGKRRFKKNYTQLPKKNGKSTMCSGIALYLTCADEEPGAEVYSVAGDKEQASIVFNESCNMVNASPELSERFNVVKSKKILEFPDTKSIYRVLSADASTKEGYNVHGLIFDEYHVQVNDDLRDVLEYSGAARDQPLFIFITTAGEDDLSPCYKEREYALAVERGDIIDITYYPLVYELDEKKDDWTKEENWYKVNPSLGVTLPIDSFREDYQKVENNPRKAGKFKRYRLNMWTNEDTKWINLDDWDKCDFDKIPKEGEECFCALDLASTQDINTAVYFFPRFKSFFMKAWVPEECNLKRAQEHKFRYDEFIKRQELIEVPGAVMDYKYIFENVTQMSQFYNMVQIGCDPYNATHLCIDLINEGLNVEYIRQNFAQLSNASKVFEKWIIEHKLRHYKNRLLKWMVKNVIVESDSHENIRPSKKKSKEKIDGVVGMIMCISMWLNRELKGKPKITIVGGADERKTA